MQIIFHIGQQKTASTTIQTFLSHNRQQLATRGVLYPKTSGLKKANILADFLFDDTKNEKWRENISAGLKAEFSFNYAKAIISEENLVSWESMRGKQALLRLKNIFEPYATSWRVLCYVRRPDEHIASNYQQVVKGGYGGNFDQFFDQQLRGSYYNYACWLDGWAEVFGENVVEARLFHRRTLQGSPVEDFLNWAEVDQEGLSFETPDHVKESFDPQNTEILRFLRLCQVQQPEVLHGHEFKRILERLRALDTGDRLKLDTDTAKRLQAQFQVDHERLADRYLPSDHAAILLAPPAVVPPQPPLDRDALSERIMTLFNDPDLARMAADNAELPSDLLHTSRKLPRPKNNAKDKRAKQQHEREERKQKRQEHQGVTARTFGLSAKVHRASEGGLAGIAGVFRRIKDRLLGKVR